MTSTPQDSVDLFLAGFSCSQSVFMPLAVEMGLDRQTALKLGQSLSGGMFVGDACGALTGATLAPRPEVRRRRTRQYSRQAGSP